MPRSRDTQRGARWRRWGPRRRPRRPPWSRAAAATATLPVVLATALGVAQAPAPASAAGPAYVANPAALVNPFIGTQNGGDTFPGADTPFGMVQWSPDTDPRPDGGGYAYASSSIIGYSLTHLSGPGCTAEGDVPILPTLGAVGADPTAATEPLDHHLESASPGYYRLDAGGIDTQLTATTRSGMATFGFPSTASRANLLFKLSDSATPVTASQFHVVNDEEVAGSVTSGQFCGATNTYTLHFDMVFNHPFTASGAWSNGGRGDYVSFDPASTPVVEAKVGISYVGPADAVQNRSVENPGWNFSSVKTAADHAWNGMLGKIQVAGGTPVQQTLFYTSLYHSLLDPSVFSDVDGRYMGAHGKVETVVAPQKAEYANYSGWDIYRSQIPLVAVVAPGRTSDIVASMLNDYTQTGQLPKWTEDGGETYAMVGDPADGIIAGAYAFGATGFDTATALADMEHEATVPNDIRPGLSEYLSDGYLPSDGTYGCCDFYGPVSTQEEYDTADNAISLFASELGHPAEARTFGVRAQNWQNVFDPGTGFIQPKLADGAFDPGFDPTSQSGFVEADSYVYTAAIPFDVPGLAAAAGGPADWVEFLNGLTSSVSAQGSTQMQIGDEPSFNIPWEYDDVGVPSKTQQVVRQIQDQDFTDTPGGLTGNDDLGAMSSWYVWSALGGYPETPGSAQLTLGSPLFTNVLIHLADGKSITETAPGAADDAPFVHGLSLDGSAWNRSTLPSDLFSDGGTLHWTLGPAPDLSWAAGPGDGPPSNSLGLLPALGYLSGAAAGTFTVRAGDSATLSFGAQSMSSAAQTLRWHASAPSGSGIVFNGAGTGTLAVTGGARAADSIAVHVPASTPAGTYALTVALRGPSGTVLPSLVAQLQVDAPAPATSP